jgi:mannose-6-phosphate isomerase-like protein (cupin superfamily)
MKAIAVLFFLGISFAAEPAKHSATYIDHEKVSAAFVKGGTIYDHGASYKVLASRRDAPGRPEIHAKEADIVYVLEGTATFVTGGTVTGAENAGPGEMRGGELHGGEERTITKGDVIIVPAGTPHWFKTITAGPVLYYVVKAR